MRTMRASLPGTPTNRRPRPAAAGAPARAIPVEVVSDPLTGAALLGNSKCMKRALSSICFGDVKGGGDGR